MAYASGTTVSVERTRSDIETLLARYGADQFMSGWETGRAVIAFRCNGRHVRFVLPLPDVTDKQFSRSPRGRKALTPDQRRKVWEQACRSRWRALLLVIKAKLEAVASGITCFEDEFLAHIVLPNGESVSKWLRPQIAAAYQSGKMPQLLLTGQEDAKCTQM